MPWRRTLPAGALAALLALLAVPCARAAEPAPAVPPTVRDVRVVFLPIALRGEPMPSRAALAGKLRRLSALYRRTTYGRLRLTGTVAPAFRAGRFELRNRKGFSPAGFTPATRAAAAAGVRFDGAIPVFIVPFRRFGASFAQPGVASIVGTSWRSTWRTAHEVGHALGLDHATSPRACPRPFDPATCAERPRGVREYGDALDLMGGAEDRLGGYSLARLGLIAVRPAPGGRARLDARPLEVPRASVVRLRTAAHDWWVEARAGTTPLYEGRVRLPRGVAVVRSAAGDRGIAGYHPRPLRVPGVDPTTACRDAPACAARQVLRPGARLVVPGAFRLRVVGAGRGGATRVETTWLDRTPPTLAVTGGAVLRRAGGAPELVLDVRAAAEGAGVVAALVDQGGAVTRVEADRVPGLVAGLRGAGRLQVPLAEGAATASVRLLDAAGNLSVPAPVDPAALPAVAAATVTFDPALGAGPATAGPLPSGRPVTVSGVTDPALAGLSWRIDLIGSSQRTEAVIGPDGAFAGTIAPPGPGTYRVVVQVPVAGASGGAPVRLQTTDGWVRA